MPSITLKKEAGSGLMRPVVRRVKQIGTAVVPSSTDVETLGPGNDDGLWSLVHMSNLEIAKPLSRAINIYRRVAGHDLDDQARREVARHMKRLANQGVHDPGRLTVHGLSYLRKLERRR